MLKAYIKFTLQLIIVIGAYFLLDYYLPNSRYILYIYIGLALPFLFWGLLSSKNYTGYLDTVVKPDLFYESIQKYKSDKADIYHLLLAYGNYYEGKTEDAKNYFSKVKYQEIDKDPKLDLVYYIVQLGLSFEEGDLINYSKTYQKALDERVFAKAKLNKDIFKVKEFVLEKKYDDAIELAFIVIPQTKKRLYIMELEYLLAVAYYETNRLDDCNAVCEFVSEKDHKVKFTDLCRAYLAKMNRTT